MNKKAFNVITIFLIAVILSSALAACSQASTTTASSKPTTTASQTATASQTTAITQPTATSKTVTDLIGRKVEVPATVGKIGAMVGPSYDKILILGGVEKIKATGITPLPWALKFYPALKSVPAIKNPQSPNVEDLLAQGVDVVFFWDIPDMTAKMTEAKIPVVVTQLGSQTGPQSQQAFIDLFKDEINIFAAVLGDDAPKRAAEYLAYYDAIVKKVTDVTSKIPAGERPKVYYVRGPKALTTHFGFSNTYWFVNMAGGDMVTKELTNGIVGDVTMEQVVKWNPDFIIMGRVATTDIIVNDPQWADINAVKNNKVLVNPGGAFYSDYGSEGALLLLYLAKTFYPDKFTDVDMVKETKYFYEHFYNYQLTDDETNRILLHQDPAQ